MASTLIIQSYSGYLKYEDKYLILRWAFLIELRPLRPEKSFI